MSAKPTVRPNSQDWANIDGVTAWHLIERHADTWADISMMMDEFIAAKIAKAKPAPQGVAEVMEIADKYARANQPGTLKEFQTARNSLEQAVTAIAQERDALKSRVAELEGDVARDAARYRWLTYSDWLDEFVMESHGIRPGISETLDVAIDAAIAAAKEPSHD